MGMTDLQFKSFLKQLIRSIENAMDEEERDALVKKLNEILSDLKGDLEG